MGINVSDVDNLALGLRKYQNKAKMLICHIKILDLF